MGTSKEELREWFNEGKARGAGYMIVVCDTFDWDDYPVYCTDNNFAERYQDHNGVHMQKVMEVYNLNMPIEEQMSTRRAFNYPLGFKEV